MEEGRIPNHKIQHVFSTFTNCHKYSYYYYYTGKAWPQSLSLCLCSTVAVAETLYIHTS